MRLKVAITGHRPLDVAGTYDESHPTIVWLKAALRDVLAELREKADVECLSGMALGTDTWAAEACVELGIPFSAFIPFEGQDSRWPDASRRRYAGLLARAQEQVVVSRLQPGAGFDSIRSAMHARNQRMVDEAAFVVAVWSGKRSGGTWDCLQRAREKGLRVILIDPVRRRVTW